MRTSLGKSEGKNAQQMIVTCKKINSSGSKPNFPRFTDQFSLRCEISCIYCSGTIFKTISLTLKPWVLGSFAIEVPILEFIHNIKYNNKNDNLIQNTPHEFAVGTEELKTIKALQLLWPLLQTKNIIRIPAKLLTTSDDIYLMAFSRRLK